jgi:adenine/guanine phosphoribosyltransferase-like PRPP-binding protein
MEEMMERLIATTVGLKAVIHKTQAKKEANQARMYAILREIEPAKNS